MWSLLAFLALVATNLPEAGATGTIPAWLGKVKNADEYKPIVKELINRYNEMWFLRGRKGIVMEFHYAKGCQHHDLCEQHAGIEIEEEGTFCGIDKIIIEKLDAENVLWTLRMGTLRKGDKRLLLQIPVAQLTEYEDDPIYKEKKHNKLTFIDALYDYGNTADNLHALLLFFWLDEILRAGLKPGTASSPSTSTAFSFFRSLSFGRNEVPTCIYETRPVHLTEKHMARLLSLF